MGQVHDLEAARKAKKHEGEVMHLVGEEGCPCGARICILCGEHVHPDDAEDGCRMTADHEVFANHPYPCKDLLIK